MLNLRDADPETAWLAGIVEGEGWVWGGWDSRRACSYRAAVGVAMTDEDIVLEVARIAGCGTIRGPFSTGLSALGTVCKDQTRWVVQDRKGFLILTQRLYPYLGTRRRAKIREIYQEAPWIEPPYFFDIHQEPGTLKLDQLYEGIYDHA